MASYSNWLYLMALCVNVSVIMIKMYGCKTPAKKKTTTIEELVGKNYYFSAYPLYTAKMMVTRIKEEKNLHNSFRRSLI